MEPITHNGRTLTVPELIASFRGPQKFEARDYQERLIHKSLTGYLHDGLRSILIESATGSGKTSMELAIIKGLQYFIPDLEVGWISMRRNLLAQTARENEKFGINAKVHLVSMFDKELPAELLAADNRMLAVDEAQHDAAGSCVHIHHLVKPRFIGGLTATPFRTDNVKLCFDKVLKDAGLGALIRAGYLAQYHHYTIPKWTATEIAKTYLREPERWGQTIIYMHRIVEECFPLAEALTRKGIAVDVVTGSSDRMAQIDRFERGETQVLVNCMVLTEGFDCPSLKTVFCRPSCKSVTIQMCGRAFRKHPDVPFKQIVQAKKGWPFVKLTMPETQWVLSDDKKDSDRQWLSLKANPHLDALGCKMLVAQASLDTPLPEFILKAQMRRRGRSRRNRINVND